MNFKKNYFILMLCFTMVFSIVSAHANYMDKNLSTGKIRIFYPGSTASACDAILLGVGTAMSRAGYDKLSNKLISHGFIVVIMDHNPGNMIKTSTDKYKALALAIKANLLTWLSSTNCSYISHWIMGGHSAGGQAAQNAVAGDPNLADGIFSIDPYNCSNTGSVDVPALYWGFNVTTCFVTKEDAAQAAYYGSTGPRAFQRVARKYTWGPCGYSPKFLHCSFADSHCPACTNCMNTPDYFFTDVANSVAKFMNAAFYGTWSKSNLTLNNPTTPVTLFVDYDQP